MLRLCRIGERIAFSFLESMKYAGDSATVCVLRKGQPHTFEVGMGLAARLHSTCLQERVASVTEGFLASSTPKGCDASRASAGGADAALTPGSLAPQWRRPFLLHCWGWARALWAAWALLVLGRQAG